MFFHVMNVLFFLAFLAMAAVQLNDPDPALWIGIYGVAALACVVGGLRKQPPAVPLVLGLLAAGGAAVLGLRVGIQPFPDINPFEDEEVRELGGLAIVAVHMAALWLDAREQRAGAPAAESPLPR